MAGMIQLVKVRALSIGAGALAIVLSIMIMTSPMLGIIFAGIVIG